LRIAYGFNTGEPVLVASHVSVMLARVPSAVMASTAPDTHDVKALPFVRRSPN
jgi:hypothetical protein